MKINPPILTEEEQKDLANFLQLLNRSFRLRSCIYFGFTIFSLIEIFTGLVSLPMDSVYALILLFLISLIFPLILKKSNLKEKLNRAHRAYLFYQTIEALIILKAIHIVGIIPLAGSIIIITYLFVSYFTYFKKNYALVASVLGIFGFLTVFLLEYFGLISYSDVYKIGINLSQHRGILVLNLATAVPLMILIVFITHYFARQLENSLKTLSQKERELKEAKSVLEIKVRARTRELEEERAGLEEKVKERTKELQEKVEELEKFHRLAVGRELKMVELKKEIKKLREEIENLKVKNKTTFIKKRKI